jgi:tetratricopeptide (TPR) repeat protein
VTIVTKIILAAIISLLGASIYLILFRPRTAPIAAIPETKQEVSPTIAVTPPPRFEMAKKLQVFQSFNNCGPATLSMALSYYGKNVSQETIGQKLRPWQNPAGINDDKSVFLYELAEEAKQYGLIPYHRPNGSIDLLRRAITHNYPVIVRTFLHSNEDIGHYRIIRGYDDTTQQVIQDDSYQGPNIRFSYAEFLSMWKPFNYEYLILIPQGKESDAARILGNDTDVTAAWQHANSRAKKDNETNPDDIHAAFNLVTSDYRLGKVDDAIEQFEKIEPLLSSRMLWYQTEPIQAYLKAKNYDKVMQMTERILTNNNLAYAELYLLRAEAYRQQGNGTAAQGELEKAKEYNQNSQLVSSSLQALAADTPLPDLP